MGGLEIAHASSEGVQLPVQRQDGAAALVSQAPLCPGVGVWGSLGALEGGRSQGSGANTCLASVRGSDGIAELLQDSSCPSPEIYTSKHGNYRLICAFKTILMGTHCQL